VWPFAPSGPSGSFGSFGSFRLFESAGSIGPVVSLRSWRSCRSCRSFEPIVPFGPIMPFNRSFASFASIKGGPFKAVAPATRAGTRQADPDASGGCRPRTAVRHAPWTCHTHRRAPDRRTKKGSQPEATGVDVMGVGARKAPVATTAIGHTSRLCTRRTRPGHTAALGRRGTGSPVTAWNARTVARPAEAARTLFRARLSRARTGAPTPLRHHPADAVIRPPRRRCRLPRPRRPPRLAGCP
jgi:hypothetical protein